METSSYSRSYVIPGDYTTATMPDATLNKGMFCWNSDSPFNCYMESDGTVWKATSQATTATYNGNTNASGDYTVTFPATKAQIPHVNPSLYPTNNAAMICRLTAVSTTGFTVKVEQRSSLNVLGIDLLSFAVTNVSGQPVRVLVVD